MTKSPTGLPAFSFNWVGGDIHGLSTLAGLLYSFSGESQVSVGALNRTVGRLISESGDGTWRGSAADGFRRDFGQDAGDVHWLSSRADSIGAAVDGLAVNLAKIESWLEGKAEQGVRAGLITIDATGKLTVPHGTSNPRTQSFLQQFNQCRAEALVAAKAARKAAAGKLDKEFKALSGGLENYKNNHRDLLSVNELKALSQNLVNLQADNAKAETLLHSSGVVLHPSAAVKGMVEGAGTVGGFAALFASETGPLDPPIATAAAVVGGVGGFFKGLVTGNGDILDW